ncbi:MAG TPA: kelch repeat-containing protein, partial [Polyangiaceae bacterium]|nr:kelch repeat-containing protein [Polyangiaceae bacterium]
MAQTRSSHSATLLQSGKVLIVGGLGGDGASSAANLASAELYDPCTNTWSPAGTLGQALGGVSAVLLHDGRVLVVGGSQNDRSVAELYDPLTNLWSPTVAPPGPGKAIRLDNGRVLVIGHDVVDHTTALYDPTTGGWSPTSLEAHPRFGFEATLLGNGKVLLSGGFSIAFYAPAVLEAELYDPASATWSPAGVLSQMRNGDAPVRLQSGRVLISGGYPQAPSSTPPASTEIYDPGTNAWSAGEHLLVARWI